MLPAEPGASGCRWPGPVRRGSPTAARAHRRAHGAWWSGLHGSDRSHDQQAQTADPCDSTPPVRLGRVITTSLATAPRADEPEPWCCRHSPANEPRRPHRARASSRSRIWVPDAAARQLRVPMPDSPPRPVPLRNVPPRTTSPEAEDDRVDQRSMVSEGPAALAFRARHERLDQRPLSVGQVTFASNTATTPRLPRLTCATRPSSVSGASLTGTGEARTASPKSRVY